MRSLSEKYDQARTNAYRLRDIFGKGNFFLEVQDQGMEIEHAHQSRSREAFARDRHSARRDERLPLPDALRRSRTGSADVHSDGQDDERCAADEVSDATSFISRRPRRWREVFRELPDAVIAHGDDRGPLQRKDPARDESVPGIQGA